MAKRFLTLWFRQLMTDWLIRRQPELKEVPFVLASPERGKMLIKAASKAARGKGIHAGMVVADGRALLPALQVFDDKPEIGSKLLHSLAEWCLRYTPVVAVDEPDGLILDISGCPHLWGGERLYLQDIIRRLQNGGYDVSAAIADTIGAAWASSRFGQAFSIIEPGGHAGALRPLPSAALRLDAAIVDRLDKLGLYRVNNFIDISRTALRRRFGQELLTRLDQALGLQEEMITPIQPIQPYQERLPSLEPIRTATGIEIALKHLLEDLCKRLLHDGKGLRKALFTCYRMDGGIEQIEIGTNKAARNVDHLFRLFELKIATITPALGIELFILEAPLVEEVSIAQEALWQINSHNDNAIMELLDRIAGKFGMQTIHRYLPAEHYWPERSVKEAVSLQEQPTTSWRPERLRPIHLLSKPEIIEVTVPIPDYPPMLFHYKGKLHKVSKADGPERIEQEWWLEDGQHRDYYCVEDEEGARYWLFRLGHYASGAPKWYLHGFFA
jgi:protein ImuB